MEYQISRQKNLALTVDCHLKIKMEYLTNNSVDPQYILNQYIILSTIELTEVH